VMSVIPTRDFSEGKFLVFATSQGMVKKTPFKDYDTPIRADGIIAINIRKGDELVRVRMSSGKDDLMLVSKSGHAIRFSEKLARPMGRGTAGVKGMNVAAKGNQVLSLDVVGARDKEGELLVVTENGYGKRTSIAEYPVKGRGGKGVLTAKLTAKKGGLAGARVVREGQELIFISQSGMVQRNAVGGISRMGRPTQGVRLMNLKKGDRVSAVALVVESEENGNGTAADAASLEDEAPSAESVAEDAAAAEAAGNGEAKVTKRSAASKPETSTAEPKAQPAKKASKPKPVSKAKTAAKPKGRAASKAKPAPKRGKVKPAHTATAKQRAEAAKKRKRK
jgi:DNA gyrase subunit A